MTTADKCTEVSPLEKLFHVDETAPLYPMSDERLEEIERSWHPSKHYDTDLQPLSVMIHRLIHEIMRWRKRETSATALIQELIAAGDNIRPHISGTRILSADASWRFDRALERAKGAL